MSTEETTSRHRRERSTRYPGVPISEALELVRFVDERGLDGLCGGEIAAAAGYKNVKTNTFSARLSAARQFGLLTLRDERYGLSPLARSILHPTDPADSAGLRRQAFLSSPLYSDLAAHLAGKRVPDEPILANLLYHNHQIITSSAKEPGRRGVPRLGPVRRPARRRRPLPPPGPAGRRRARPGGPGPRAGPADQADVDRRPDRPPPLGRRRGEDDPRPRARVDLRGELRPAPPSAKAPRPIGAEGG